MGSPGDHAKIHDNRRRGASAQVAPRQKNISHPTGLTDPTLKSSVVLPWKLLHQAVVVPSQRPLLGCLYSRVDRLPFQNN